MRYSSPIITTLIALGLTALTPALAHAGSLPPLINFQSVLLDEGGNLLPSGPTTVQFQILDENHAPIYSETQSVEIVKGAVAALIGNGADSKGAASGGIPDDVFASGAPRYLQVQVGNHAPEDPMTIVPVPYAQWSETCATVADGSVAGGKIAKAAVGFEHLAPDVVSKLADEMSKSQGVVTAQSLGSNGGATQIGVEAKFINSGSSTIQGVLQDIDLSVKKRQEETTFLTGKLNEEVTNRTNALNDEIKNRTDAVSGVQGKLDQEVKDRAAAVIGVQSKLDYQLDATKSGSLAQKIESEAVTRSGADGGLQSQITKIMDGTTQTKISPNSIDFSKPFPSDINMNNHKITNLGAPTENGDASTRKYVNDTIGDEATLRSDADGQLQGKINTINTTISNINNIPGVLDKSKLPPEPAVSAPIPPVLSGEVAWGDFTFYKYTSSQGTTTTANLEEGIKFIPFNEPETLAQNTCTNLPDGHNCNYAEIQADNKIYNCKVGIKFNISGHTWSNGEVYATCEYTTRAKLSSIQDWDGPNMDYAVQRGILIHVYNNGFTATGAVSVPYKVYQIPVATQ